MENMKIPQEWMALFKAGNSIRPCSFDPTPFLRPGDVVEGRAPSVHLPLDAKRVWFHTYCNEQGVKGYILCGEPKINFDLTHSNGAKIGFVTCDCNIVIDDVVVANACAGLAVFVDNITDLSMAIQNCSGTAQSRALSNAGFGAVSGTELVTNDNPTPSCLLPWVAKAKPTPIRAIQNPKTSLRLWLLIITAQPLLLLILLLRLLTSLPKQRQPCAVFGHGMKERPLGKSLHLPMVLGGFIII